MIKAAIPGGQKPRDWMWIQYKRAQAAGPQPTRPEPLSVWPSGSASSGTCDHAARRECMLQEVRAGVEMAAHRRAAWRANPERAASPKIPRAESLDPAKADDRSWDSSDPVCLGIAELSRHGMARGAVRPTR